MNKKILLLPLALIGIGIYYQSWLVKAHAYEAYIQSFLDDIVEKSNGTLSITIEGLKVSGFPFSHKVEMIHSSLIGKVNDEHLEVHSHHIIYDLKQSGDKVSHALTWLEPVKVIYGKGEEKRTYKVYQKELFPVALTYKNVVEKKLSALMVPDALRVTLPKDIYLVAKCGEAKQTIHFPFPLANAPVKLDIPENLYDPLRILVYMVDEALKGQGKCSDSAKSNSHQHNH